MVTVGLTGTFISEIFVKFSELSARKTQVERSSGHQVINIHTHYIDEGGGISGPIL